MKRIAFFLGALLMWGSSQASEMFPINYQCVKPVSKDLNLKYSNTRVAVYCAYKGYDTQDSLLIMQFAQKLRKYTMESPAVPLMAYLNFGLLPMTKGENQVSDTSMRELMEADTLDDLIMIDRISGHAFGELALQYKVEYRILNRQQEKIRSFTESKMLTLDDALENNAAMLAMIADYFANTIFPYWENQERYVYRGSSAQARAAFTSAEKFKWKEAVQEWIRLSSSANDEVAAEMSYNVAVGLEALGEYELALKWLRQSLSYKDLDDDQRSLEKILIKKQKQLVWLNEQMK